MSKEKLYLSVISISNFEKYDHCYWGPGVRDIYIIHYVKRGRGYYETGGKKYSIGPGQSFIIYPGELVHYYPDEDEPWEYAWTDFMGIEAKKLLEYCCLTKENPVTEQPCPELEELFVQGAAAYDSQSPQGICRNVAYFRLIMAKYIECYPAGNGGDRGDTALTRAAEYIEENYRRPGLCLEDIAKVSGLNRVTLHRKFVGELGVSPGKYVNDLRLQKACNLLRNGDYSVKAVAYSVGSSDQPYFSKAFKRQFGLTPTQYRKKQL